MTAFLLDSDDHQYDKIMNQSQFEQLQKAFGDGKNSFKDQSFAAAVENFDQAMEHVTEKLTVTILLNRVIALENMKEYAKMLVDARRIIEHAPKFSGGYLLAARSLAQQGRVPEALAMYESAIKLVDQSDPF